MARPVSQRQPGYAALLRSGDLQERASLAIAQLASCGLCPRDCGFDRSLDEKGVCRTGRRARVSSYFPHFGEESCLTGAMGSGTIFFSQCNLRCVFCQNYEISHYDAGIEVEAEDLARMMLELQMMDCHNINLVTPSHVIPQTLEALVLAAGDGLRLPIVYNSNGYDRVETLRMLEGVVDIYMPDFKAWNPSTSMRYLTTEDYPEVAREAVREMHRQVGDLAVDDRGIARRGLLVRHLVMPGQVEESASIFGFLAREISPATFVNIMGQYRPAGEAVGDRHPSIARRVTSGEMAQAFRRARAAGLRRFDGERG